VKISIHFLGLGWVRYLLLHGRHVQSNTTSVGSIQLWWNYCRDYYFLNCVYGPNL